MDCPVLEIVSGSIADDVINEPVSRLVLLILVTVYFLLVVCPVGECFRVGPEQDLCWNVRKPEMSRQRFPSGSIVRVIQLKLEQGVVSPVVVVWADGRKLLVGRHERRSDIVRDEQGVSDDMFELNDIVVSDNPSSTSLWDLFGRDNLPVVVGIVVWVACDLLTLRTDSSVIVPQRVLVDMRMQELFRVLVLDCHRVKVPDFYDSQRLF